MFFMNLAGSLLISASDFPALSAMRLFQFKGYNFSAILSVVCAFWELLSYTGNTAGPTIVAVDVFAFLICYVAGLITGGFRNENILR